MKALCIVLCVLLILAILGSMFFAWTPIGQQIWQSWRHDVKKAGENANYENRKQVEDTCRAMIASYESDKLMYEQYKDSEDSEERSWGQSAKIRANKTASEYNNYMLKNSYIWDGNIPNDIDNRLPIIE